MDLDDLEAEVTSPEEQSNEITSDAAVGGVVKPVAGLFKDWFVE